MSKWTRRDLLRATAATAAAAPAVALSGRAAFAGGASPSGAAGATAADEELDTAEAATVAAGGPMMVCVHDAGRGDVSILHGTSETVVRDRRLVAKIVRARSGAKEI